MKREGVVVVDDDIDFGAGRTQGLVAVAALRARGGLYGGSRDSLGLCIESFFLTGGCSDEVLCDVFLFWQGGANAGLLNSGLLVGLGKVPDIFGTPGGHRGALAS